MAILISKRTTLLHLIVAIFFLVTLTACGSLRAAAVPTLSPQAIRGKGVFESYCSRCHGTTGEIVVVGPSLAGIATRGAERVQGMDAPTYIRDSILNPTAYTVDGFPEGIMPGDLKDQIPAEDVDAIVAYLLTLQ